VKYFVQDSRTTSPCICEARATPHNLQSLDDSHDSSNLSEVDCSVSQTLEKDDITSSSETSPNGLQLDVTDSNFAQVIEDESSSNQG